MNAVSKKLRPVRFLFALLICAALFALASCSFFRADEPETSVEAEDKTETAAAEPAKTAVEINAPLVMLFC